MQSKSLATDTGRDTIMENHSNKKENSNYSKNSDMKILSKCYPLRRR